MKDKYVESDSARPEKVRIYYTDPRRGAGHLAQGKAVAKKLEVILGKDAGGEWITRADGTLTSPSGNVELINFDTKFAGPRGVEHYNRAFNSFRGDPAKSKSKYAKYISEYVRFYGSLDRKRMVKELSEPGVLPVFANPQLGWVAQKAGVSMASPCRLIRLPGGPWTRPCCSGEGARGISLQKLRPMSSSTSTGRSSIAPGLCRISPLKILRRTSRLPCAMPFPASASR